MKTKIDFRQPKYALPAIALIPGLVIIYFLLQVFSGDSKEELVAQAKTDQINAALPDANTRDVDDKYTEMRRRYGNRNGESWSGISGFNDPEEGADSIESSAFNPDRQVSEIELEDIRETDMDGQWEEDLDIKRLEEALARSRSALSGTDNNEETPQEMEARVRREIEAELEARRAALEPVPAMPVATPEVVEEKIEIVEKADVAGGGHFNTISSQSEEADAALIKAMIDQTTKAQDGTRIRFKLLDDVKVKGMDIRKGSYLYGTVVGFGSQRVKVAVNSILLNGKFIKVKLAAYDVDGMEGFYVPASSFREFMRDAASRTSSTSLQINQGYGSAITGEMLALQALQNVYNAASSAATNQIRKNKAKIKYNTIVYLINSESI